MPNEVQTWTTRHINLLKGTLMFPEGRKLLAASDESIEERMIDMVRQSAATTDASIDEAEERAISNAVKRLQAGLAKIQREEKQAERRSNASEAISRLEREFSRAVSTSRNATCQQLTREVGIIADRHRACEAWLYVASSEEERLILRAQVTHRTNQRGRTLAVDESAKGIVAYVAKTRKPYLARDISSDDLYVSCNPATKTELAVPILGSHDELLGVLNLESSLDDFSFTIRDLKSVEVAAKRLAIGLLCLRRNKESVGGSWPWSPADGRWDGRRVPEEVSWAVGIALSKSNEIDSCNCILWNVDRPKKQLWVMGTTSYDSRYQAHEFLDQANSYSGLISKLKRGTVKATTPDTAPMFQEVGRAKAAGLKRMFSAPLYRNSRDRTSKSEDSAWAVLHAYYFGNDCESLMPTQEAFEDIASLVEDWLSGYEQLRSDCAASYLHWKMEASRLEWQRKSESDQSDCCVESSGLYERHLNLMRDLLVDVLDADGCTIFVPDRKGENIFMATSTGVELDGRFDGKFIALSADNSCPVCYVLNKEGDDEYGLLSYLHDHPKGQAVRINSLKAFDDKVEQGPPGVPQHVVWKHMEPLCDDSDDRRFMGGTIIQADGMTAVVRLVRSIQKPPFTEDDALIFDRLLKLCEAEGFWSVTPPVAKENDLVGVP